MPTKTIAEIKEALLAYEVNQAAALNNHTNPSLPGDMQYTTTKTDYDMTHQEEVVIGWILEHDDEAQHDLADSMTDQDRHLTGPHPQHPQ